MEPFKGNVDKCIEQLAKNCGIETVQDLFSIELSDLLDEMKESYEEWDRNSPDRFIFNMLVRRSFTAVVDYWETILMIIASNVEHDKDYDLRMDMLDLCEHFLRQKELSTTIVFYSEIILKMILLPCMQWRVGKPGVSIRKAALICIIQLLDNQLIEKEKLQENFTQLFNGLKISLDDDWVHDLRFAAVVCLKKLIGYLHEGLAYDDWKNMYTEMLKRLDDAQDGIRIECCKAFEVFFDVIPDPWNNTFYEYTVKNILIHLDDQSPAIQEAVTAVLRKASRVQTKDFIQICTEFESKSAHPALVKSLIGYAQETHLNK